MSFNELSRDQKIEAKQSMLCEQYDKLGKSPSWGELADADETISDAEAKEYYGGTNFVPEDFSCSADERKED